MINTVTKSPINSLIGLLFILALSACQSENTAEQTTLLFWSSIAENDLEQAKIYSSSKSHPMLSSSQHEQFKNTSFDYGKIIVEDDKATVETKISPALKNRSKFSTFLIKEHNIWKVEYKRSINDLAGNQILKDFVENLNNLGQDINKKFEQQLPIIEKELETFGEELKQQIDKLGKELKKSTPPQQQNPYKESI